MSSPHTPGDPRTGRDRRLPARQRTFKDGHVDPVINNKRPLLTVGNVVLLVVGVGYGMYATGHLPELDEFFNHMDAVGKANNNAVVGALITYGSVLFGLLLFALVGLFIFSMVNTHRRRASDPKGWQKEATDEARERRLADRRQTADLPSLIMPIGKEKPHRRAADQQPSTPRLDADPPAVIAAAAAEIASPIPTPSPTPTGNTPSAAPVANTVRPAAPDKPSPAKLAAMQAAAEAEAAADSAPPDLPSFVMPYAKLQKAKPDTKLMKAVVSSTQPQPSVDTPPTHQQVQAPQAAKPDADVTAAAPVQALSAVQAASIAAAQAAALEAEAALAAAKAEAALATAKAEAALAAAKAQAAIAVAHAEASAQTHAQVEAKA